MGWTCTVYHKRNSFKEYFEERFNHEKGKVLDCAVVNRSTAYIAYKCMPPDKSAYVVCLVVLLKWYYQGKYNLPEICYKDMDETMGPNESRCPERILKQLSPLEDFTEEESNSREWAQEWRNRCWEFVNRGKAWRKIKDGQVIKLHSPIHFTDGILRDLFEVRSKKPLRFHAVNVWPDGIDTVGGLMKFPRDLAKAKGFDVIDRDGDGKLILNKEVKDDNRTSTGGFK